ncbi:hypothetical protein PoB_001114200 [Plakobranchus ocellatus]|uniref:Uncharacterized protein n=1 Tax=Plakobranchus ocellatus TaxID=259542 RepID=A0AAV3YR50_9GAST|nr:hypothetical protein PoB_001114200 [Plakobranchus ocellatus]
MEFSKLINKNVRQQIDKKKRLTTMIKRKEFERQADSQQDEGTELNDREDRFGTERLKTEQWRLEAEGIILQWMDTALQ